MTALIPPSCSPERPPRSETGDTLIEVLLAIVILGLASVAILLAFSTSISGSAEHRSLSTQDTVLRTAAEGVTSDFQQQSGSPYSSCAADGAILIDSPSLLTGYTATTTVNYWNGTAFGPLNTGTCVADSPQMITITVSYDGGAPSPPLNVVVNDPELKPIASFGAASQFVFLTPSLPVTTTAGSALATQPVVAIEDASGNIVPDDLAAVQLSISTATDSNGAALFNCSGSEFGGVISFSGCEIDTAGTYELTASDQLTTGGLTSGNSLSYTITAGVAAQLQFTSMPTGTTSAGTTFDSAFGVAPAVTVEDKFGNPVTGNTDAITLAITSGTGTSGAALTCTVDPVHAVGGVATFAGCWINLAGTNYTLRATDGSVSVTSSSNDPITITAGAASKLAFTSEPSGAATGGTAFATQPVVSVEDAYGNTVTTNTDGITLAITAGTGTSGATFSCTTNPLTAVSGVATFNGCSINKSGMNYTLTATSSPLAPATSSALTITVGPAAQLVFSTQPLGGVNEGTAFATQPVVTVEDSGGNVVTTDTGTVALAIANYTAGNGGTTSGTLGCTANSVSAVAGVATFANCQITGTAAAGTYTLSATRSGLTSGTSSNVTITAGTATKLVFSTEPVGGVNEATNFATQPKVSVEDANGNVVTTDTGTVALAIANYTAGNGGTTSGTLGCTANSVSAVAGVATFANCQITGTAAAGTYTLSATRSGLTSGTSSNVTITAVTATKLVFSTEPVGGANGAAFSTQPTVTVEDANGNVVTSSSASISLAIATQPGSGATLTCTSNPLAASSGIASFAGCKIVGKIGSYTLTATSSPLAPATSSALTITVGPAAQLVFSTQPLGGVNEGTAFATQPVVTVEDSGGNVVTTDTGTVALAIANYTAGNGGTTSGTLGCTANSVSAVAGVATFANCQITGTAAAGTYTLSATRSGLTSGTSSNVTITAGTATKLVFSTEPVGGVNEATNFATQPKVSVEDANGNVVTTDTGTVALAIANYTAGNGGTTSGTLGCTANSVSAVAGVATFANCQITGTAAAGTYTLSATRSGLTSGTSSNVTITAVTATKLVFSTEPVGGANGAAFSTQPTVTVEDANGNVVTSSSASISLAIATQPGSGATLTCTSNPLAASSGIASFAGCKIVGKIGSYTLTATSSPLAPATSSALTITVGPAAQLVFSTQPLGGVNEGTAFATQPVVTVEDSGGNVVTTDTGTVALAIANYTAGNGGTTSGTLGCTANSVSAVAGVATFANCQITGTAAAGTYTLSATRSGLTSGTSSNVTITAGTATKLVFSTEPVGGVNEATNFATQPKVSVEDANGNVVTTDTGTVALAIANYTAGNGGTTSGTLGCTANSVSAVAGVATFANCQITGTAAAGTYTLSATRSGLTSGTSSNVTITAVTATKLVFSTSPSASTTATAFGTQPVIAVEDANGNTVTSSAASVTLAIATQPGSGSTLTCTSNPLAASSGIVSFAGCHITIGTTAGAFTLKATATGLTAGTSASFTVAGAAAKLVFTTQPVGGSHGTLFATEPVVSVEDSSGDVVTTSTASITLAIGTNPGGGSLTCTTNPLAATNGVATYAGCSISAAGTGYTLKATASGLTTATSSTFNLS